MRRDLRYNFVKIWKFFNCVRCWLISYGVTEDKCCEAIASIAITREFTWNVFDFMRWTKFWKGLMIICARQAETMLKGIDKGLGWWMRP